MGMNVMHAPEIPDSVEWVNTTGNLEMEDLCEGHDLVMIGFWSHADLASWSLLEDLVSFSEEFGPSVISLAINRSIVPGSPELPAGLFPPWISEQLLLGEDRDGDLARAYQSDATPSLAIVNASGNLVAMLSGGIDRSRVRKAIKMVLDQIDGVDRKTETPVELKHPPGQLTPRSIAVNEDGSRLAVSDPFRNRVVILDREGTRLHSIGQERPGDQSGDFSEACFRFPLGLTFHEENLLVCDSGNHALKGIDLETETVYSITLKTSEQAEKNFLRPVDLTVRDDQFWVTLAGSDQIARIDRLEDTKVTYLGSGARGTDDGGPGELTMAQPAGITSTEDEIFFVDSLAGSLRRYFPREDRGETLIQTGLYQGGDQDGEGEDARLRFPVDLWHHEPFLYLVDRYNHALKRYDPETDEIEHWLGGDENGSKTGDVTGLQSPAGICGTDNTIWITDPGHGRIVEIDCEDWNSSVFWEQREIE